MAELNTNYVKFKRGTPAAFSSIIPDFDTLYFIYEEDENFGELYLGSKKIIGSNGEGDITGSSSLRELKDVLLSNNLNANDGLIYDVSASKWVNKPIIDILTAFVGTNGISDGKKGLVPAPLAGQANMFLRSDGKWAEIITSSAVSILQTLLGTNETHEQAIKRIVGEAISHRGDIVIITDIISGDISQNTSYIYNGEKWVAMDGNYNAKNVYLANDLIITEDIGVQKIEEGSSFKVLETSGKSVEQIFNMIFNSRRLPTYKEPSITITCEEAGKYEVGTILSPSYKVDLYKGEYEFEPKEDTGVEITSATAIFDGVEINAVEGYFDDIVVADKDEHVILVDVEYSSGIAPKDNYGVEITDADELRLCQIQGGKISGQSGTISGYRNMFMGSSTEKFDVTSDNIRNLDKHIEENCVVQLHTEENTKQIVIAIPSEHVVTEVADHNAFEINILEKFNLTNLSVAGASAGYEKDYKVYVYTPPVALGANTYTIRIEQGGTEV